ncbi:endoglucanase family 5 glycoside hydrolase [Ephemerocybe angulata]|uniref:Endoglucanase family 5 glycoside hydrolase n=1 Tax=Ephemerocybe angulata TaxID=980116 RepID=A0A8H6MCM8_9AGAR|nr:endoglucanase family 5 glycoside hydrolase [Tulosesus angulatus]
MSFLKVEGTKLVDADGNEVVLHGAGLGGWMSMENFISGFPGCEVQMREGLEEAIGKEKADFFHEKFLEYFFAEADAKFFKSLGLNCIRIGVNYRHFEDDLNPRVLKPDCFKHLDRAVEFCAKYSIYTIIDLHNAPGGQNGGWHADTGFHLATFWRYKDFQDRFVWLWKELATHYKGNPWIAGYNLLNEPADPHPEHQGVITLYDRLHDTIRAIDKDHILFLDGNTFSTDFSKFPDDAGTRWTNTAYAIHDYSWYGLPGFTEPYEGTDAQKEVMLNLYKSRREWIDKHELCVWNGEWGPVYARREYDGDATDDTNARRFAVLRDQLDIYEKDRLSWCIWLYKDLGFQGMVYVSPTTPYRRRFADFIAKKHRLAVDAWGKDERPVEHIYAPIVSLIEESVPEPSHLVLYPPRWGHKERVTRLARTMLVAEMMLKEWTDLFKGLDETELDELAKSFAFENCLKRDGLNNVLKTHATRVRKVKGRNTCCIIS